jgi:hypothetical protein
MNNRMTELYAKACLEARDIHQTDVPAFISCMAEKFGNLIVREAIMALYEDDGATHHERLLTEHFGICDHEWVSAKNPVVVNGSICVKCGALDPREPEELR